MNRLPPYHPYLLLLATVCLMPLKTVMAGETVTLIPSVTTGVMNYKYEEAYADSSPQQWQGSVPYGGIGATLIWNRFDRFALDVYVQKTAMLADEKYEETIFRGQGTGLFNDYNADLKRQDQAVTLSYQVTDYIDVAVGYKWGQTNLDIHARTSRGDEVREHAVGEANFENEGFSGALGLSFPIGQTSSVGVNFAYASLTGKYDYNERNLRDPKEEKSPVQVNDSPAEGRTLGLRWNGKICNSLSYGISADYFSYDLKATGVAVETDPARKTNQSSLSEISEQIITVRATINWEF